MDDISTTTTPAAAVAATPQPAQSATQANTQANPAPETTQTPAPHADSKPEKPQDIASAILAAVEAATSKKEKTVVRSMAEQYNLTDEEAQTALNEAKAKKAKQIPPETQAQVDALLSAAGDRLIAAEVKSLGVTMGLVDADAALLLMNREAVKVGADGKITGVKEALEALRTAKAYLFTAQPDSTPKPTGEKKNVGGKVDAGGNEPDLGQFRRMGYQSRAKLKVENPTLYESLAAQERTTPEPRRGKTGA